MLALAVASRPEGTAGRAERDSQRLAPSRFPPPPQAACELESCAPVSARKTPPVGTAKKAGWQSRFVPTKSAIPLSTAISVDHEAAEALGRNPPVWTHTPNRERPPK